MELITYKPGRRCKKCKCILSMYNPNTYCSVCRIKLIDKGELKTKGGRNRKLDLVEAVIKDAEEDDTY